MAEQKQCSEGPGGELTPPPASAVPGDGDCLADLQSPRLDRNTIIAPGLNLTDEQIGWCFDLVIEARRATPNPSQSNFFVRSAAMVDNGLIALGGNRESHHSHAWIHGETAAISTAKQMFGERRIRAIGYDFPGAPLNLGLIASCGNCRDILNAEAPDAIIAAGSSEGIVIGNVDLMRFNPTVKVPTESITPEIIAKCLAAKDVGVEVYLPDSLKSSVYVALLVTNDGALIPGSLYTNAGYDFVPPGLSAVQAYRHSEARSHDISALIFAGFGALPQVYYRDRQAVLELDEVLQSRFDRGNATSVTCVNIDPETRTVSEAVSTNVVEWMPYPFSPRSFGMDGVIEEMARRGRV